MKGVLSLQSYLVSLLTNQAIESSTELSSLSLRVCSETFIASSMRRICFTLCVLGCDVWFFLWMVETIHLEGIL